MSVFFLIKPELDFHERKFLFSRVLVLDLLTFDALISFPGSEFCFDVLLLLPLRLSGAVPADDLVRSRQTVPRRQKLRLGLTIRTF